MTKRNRVTDSVYLLPVFVFTLSILLVRLHLFSMPLTDIYWSEATDTTTLSDVFSYWKCLAILAAGGLTCILAIVGYFGGQIQFKKSVFYIPAFIYVCFVLLSYLFSDYKYFALRGMQEHFEGTIILLAYITLLFFMLNVIDSKRRLKMVVICVLSLSMLLGILGITQAIGHDFFSTAIGQKLMTPNYTLDTGIKSWDMIDILATTGQKAYDFSFTEGEVYQTVYNINYVPLYLSLLIPIGAILFIFTLKKGNNLILSGICLGLFGLFLYNFFSANSSSGYAGLMVILIAALAIFHKYLKQWVKPIVCLLIITGLVLGLTVNQWLPEVKSLLGNFSTDFFDFVYAEDLPNIQYEYEKKPASISPVIDYIETNQTNLVFSINGNELVITRDDASSSFAITDGDSNPLYLSMIPDEDNVFQILDVRYHDFVKLSLTNDGIRSVVLLSTRAHDWHFAYDNGQFKYVNSVGKDVILTKIPHSGLIKSYSFANGRGLIWDTIIPQLKNYIFIGAGADVFSFVYPQNDYATAYTVDPWTKMNLVTDKAHNLYMQYWVNTGLISLLAWLTMVGYYLVGSVKQFRKRGFVDFCDFVNGGIFCGICGFLAVAFFNDGSVNTMPMFYTMLGTGLAINMRDKWPGEETVGETSGSDGADPGEGKKKGKKAKTAAEVMPEM